MAVIPFDEHNGKSLGEIVVMACRLYDDSKNMATAKGELSAVRKVCAQMGIGCEV